MILITGQELREIAPKLTANRAAEIAALHNKIAPTYGIDTLDEFEEFLANVTQESGEYAHKSENLYYRPQRLAEVWPKTFSATKIRPYIPNDAAYKYAFNPVALGNFKYGGRYGNRPGTNDGFDFRGAGFIGLTFRSTFESYTVYLNKKNGTNLTVEQVANLVRTSDEYAMDSAYWFFSVLKSLNDEAERDEWRKIVKSINGGFIGIEDREKYLARVKKVFARKSNKP